MSLTPEELAALDLAVETLKRSGLSVELEDLLTFISRRRWTTSWRPVTSMSLGSRMAILPRNASIASSDLVTRTSATKTKGSRGNLIDVERHALIAFGADEVVLE